MASYDRTLKKNFKIFVAGPSGCGKTIFACDIIQNWPIISRQAFSAIIYCWNQWQPKYDEMKQLVTHWVRDDDNMIRNIKSIARGKPVFIIFDDAINSKSLPEIANLFMIDGRHSNMSMMFLSQRMFDKDKSFMQISRNSDYFVVFKNPRDASEIGRLAQQLTPGKRGLLPIYEEATKDPWSYLFIDLTQECPPAVKYTSHLFDENGVVRVYQES